MPGGMWNGLNNYAQIPNTLRYGGSGGGGGTPNRPVRPVEAPRAGHPGLVAVSSRPIVRSEVTSRESFTFRQDSAGLGVPRDAFGKLDKYSQHVETHGTVNEHVYFSAPTQTMQGGRPTNTAVMAGLRCIADRRRRRPWDPSRPAIMVRADRAAWLRAIRPARHRLVPARPLPLRVRPADRAATNASAVLANGKSRRRRLPAAFSCSPVHSVIRACHLRLCDAHHHAAQRLPHVTSSSVIALTVNRVFA